jgi:hypothetical protein
MRKLAVIREKPKMTKASEDRAAMSALQRSSPLKYR